MLSARKRAELAVEGLGSVIVTLVSGVSPLAADSLLVLLGLVLLFPPPLLHAVTVKAIVAAAATTGMPSIDLCRILRLRYISDPLVMSGSYSQPLPTRYRALDYGQQRINNHRSDCDRYNSDVHASGIEL